MRIVRTMADPSRRAKGSDGPARTGPALPPAIPRAPEPSGGRRRLPEPPALRTDPLTSPRACVNCAQPVSASGATPRCWGCGRALCA